MAQGRHMTQASKISQRDEPRVGMHIGDLRLTEAELPNHLVLRDIIAQANAHLARQTDFVVLPGDNADLAMDRGVLSWHFNPLAEGRKW
ncbi:hypothetical protein PQR64_08485 [Paraburkholderia phytofirmans]|uniref:hypothetical protein n=1 Tax=Paraburkholderia phytofirmans TaxID=261302 RepID=UPI0038BD9920